MHDDHATLAAPPPGWRLPQAGSRALGASILLVALVQVSLGAFAADARPTWLPASGLAQLVPLLLALWLILDDAARARWSHAIALAVVAAAVAILLSPLLSPTDRAGAAIGGLAAAAGLALWTAAPASSLQALLRAMGALQLWLVVLALASDWRGGSGLRLGWSTLLAHLVFGAWLFLPAGSVAARHRVSSWCAAAMLGMGLLVMAGWVFGSAAIVHGGTQQVPMQFQTALCVALAGLSLWQLAHERHRSALSSLLPVIPVIVVAAAALVEEYAGPMPGIGQWLLGQGLVADGFTTDKMAASTAIAFLLGAIGVGLAPMQREAAALRWSGTWACGFVVAVIAVLVSAGYLLDIAIVQGWGMQRPMAMTTGLAMAAYGLGLGFVGPQMRARDRHRGLWLPLLVAAGSVVASILVWYAIDQNRVRGEQARVDQQVQVIRRTLNLGMRLREEALQRLADRLATGDEASRARALELDARLYLRDFPSLVTIAWIDRDGLVRQVFVRDRRWSPAIGQPLDMGGSARGLLQYADSAGRSVSPPMLLSSGQWGQWVVARVKRDGQVQGFLAGAMHHDDLFANLLADVAPQFSLHLDYGGQTLYARGQTKDRPALSRSFADLGYPVQLQLWPQGSDDNGKRLANILLFTGLATGGLLALVLYLAALARERAELAEDAGRRLGIGIAERRDSEERLRAILETAVEGIIIIDEHGRMESVNPAGVSMFGYPAAQMVGSNVRMLMPEPYRAEHDAYLGNYRRTGQAKVIGIGREVTGQRKDGSTFPLDLSVSELRLAGRRMFAGFIRDISERKQAEAAIRESEQRFRTMANAMPQLAWIAHADGTVHWYNQRWYEYTGTTPEQMQGAGWQDVHDPRTLPLVTERWTATIATGADFEMEYPLRGADGRFRVFLTRVQPLKDAQGRVMQWFGTNTDVSELKRSEQALREASQRLELALDSARLGTFDFRPATGEVFWDARMAKLWGMPPEAELDYASAVTRIHPDDRARVERTIQEMLASGNSDYRLDYRIVWPDGSVHWRVDRGEIFFEEQGRSRQAARVIGIHMDVSERKEMDLQLQRTLLDLSNRNRELQDFAFIASHDLQEPLRKIRAFSDRLLIRHAEQFDEQARDYLVRTGHAAERMQTLIDDLLAYSRVSARGRPFANVELSSLVAAVLDDLEARLESSEGQVEADALPALEGDATQLRQVFQNLMANALKFRSPERPPRVRVSAEPTWIADGQRAWTIRIEDNGIGFDPKYAERVFAPFQRLHSRQEYEGTGIGLAIVRRIVERHQGRIHAEGRLGHGATFIMVLPERQPAAADDVLADAPAGTEAEHLT